MTSVLNVDTIADKAGTGPVGLTKQMAVKSWHSFNGTSTVATSDSFNVSSLTDSDTGQYATVFTNNMSNGNYSHSGFSEHDGGTHALFATSNKDNHSPSTSKAGIDSFRGSDNTAVDSSQMTHMVIGDLA